MKTVRDAEFAIRQKFAASGFRGELCYDPSGVIENERWWFVPCGWVGCFGCIVNKNDLYVSWLGSSTFPIDDCFWGHDRALFNDLVDFTFAPGTDRSLAEKLVSQFHHMHPNARGVHPKQPVPYRDSEVAAAVSSQFPTFRRHNVWLAIPAIRQASETHGLQFSSELSTYA